MFQTVKDLPLRGLDPFYVVTCYVNWVKTSWTFNIDDKDDNKRTIPLLGKPEKYFLHGHRTFF